MLPTSLSCSDPDLVQLVFIESLHYLLPLLPPGGVGAKTNGRLMLIADIWKYLEEQKYLDNFCNFASVHEKKLRI